MDFINKIINVLEDNHFHNRFEAVCQLIGKSPTKICKELELHPNAWYKYQEGTLPSMITLGKLKTLYPMVNLDYLILGHGTPFLPEINSDEPNLLLNEPSVVYNPSEKNVLADVIKEWNRTNKKMLEYFEANIPAKN